MRQEIQTFLKEHWDGKSPLLLGLSGGPDSKALLHLLREVPGLLLHVAHIDHGWREESGREALLLQAEVEALHLPFYSTRLVPPEKNREAVCREARLQFFRSLFDKAPFQALLLAHQADDLAETTLKRIFEGAHLTHVSGMGPVGHLAGMAVWRPLLGVRKREILAFLEKEKIAYFIDPTNRDVKYLRSRMREETLPLLERSFGKGILSNLLHLAERSEELEAYLDRRIEKIPVIETEWGVGAFLYGIERIEARHWIQKRASFPRNLLENLLDSVSKRRWHKTPFGIAGRGWLFILFKKTEPQPFLIQEIRKIIKDYQTI